MFQVSTADAGRKSEEIVSLKTPSSEGLPVLLLQLLKAPTIVLGSSINSNPTKEFQLNSLLLYESGFFGIKGSMSRLWARFAGLFINRTFMGMDKAGNKYFARTEQIDGIVKEKRWVIFKGDHDPTTIPVEWICWLNGQRTSAPTPEEMAELEARRERVKLNVARLRKEEEEERKSQKGKAKSVVKAAGPDLKSFIQQLRADEEGNEVKEASEEKAGTSDKTTRESQEQKETPEHVTKQPESSEPTGSGPSFRPGTWQPPT